MASIEGVRAHFALALGVMVIGTAAILIRLADAPALVIGAYRLTIGSLVLTCPAIRWLRRDLPKLDRRGRGLLLLSGLALGIHFASWITSLEYTTVASSAVLVTTNPIFVGLASRFFFRERMSRETVLGIVLSVIGGITIGYGDFAISGRALLGDGLALIGAVMMSLYILVGRRLRRRLFVLSYVVPVYWVAALLLTGACMVSGYSFTGYSLETYLIFAALALGPQVVGHSAINYSLGHLSSSFVTVAILAESVVSIVLAWVILNEAPTVVRAVGAVIILTGVYFASRAEQVGEK